MVAWRTKRNLEIKARCHVKLHVQGIGISGEADLGRSIATACTKHRKKKCNASLLTMRRHASVLFLLWQYSDGSDCSRDTHADCAVTNGAGLLQGDEAEHCHGGICFPSTHVTLHGPEDDAFRTEQKSRLLLHLDSSVESVESLRTCMPRWYKLPISRKEPSEFCVWLFKKRMVSQMVLLWIGTRLLARANTLAT